MKQIGTRGKWEWPAKAGLSRSSADGDTLVGSSAGAPTPSYCTDGARIAREESQGSSSQPRRGDETQKTGHRSSRGCVALGRLSDPLQTISYFEGIKEALQSARINTPIGVLPSVAACVELAQPTGDPRARAQDWKMAQVFPQLP